MAKRRRLPGEGSIYQESSSGRWAGVVDLGWKDGRRVRRKVTAKTAEQVRIKLRKLHQQIDQGAVPDAASLEAWLTYWLDNIAAHKVKPKTLSGYRTQCNVHIIPAIGKRRLRDLSPDHVRELHATQRRKGLAPASIRQTHAVLSKALAVALKEGKVSRNVAQIAETPSAPKNPHKTMAMNEALAVLRATKDDPRMRARVAIALMAGMRQGEALGLKWTDITTDGEVGLAVITETVQQIPGRGLVTGTPKTAGSARAVPLVDVVVGALEAWREVSGGRGYVFHGHAGPMSPDGPRRDWQAWKDALAAAGVRHIPLHGARGSTASILQAKGVPVRIIADIMGHSQVQTTHDHYLHSDAGQRLAAMQQAFGDWRELLELEG